MMTLILRNMIPQNVHLTKGRLFSDIDKVKLRIYNIVHLIMLQYNFFVYSDQYAVF